MKKKRFAVEQIVAILKQAELGIPIVELIRQVGVSEQTFYRWKKKYSGLEIDQVRQLKQMGEENARLNRNRGRSDLGQGHATGRAEKKILRSSRYRPVVEYLGMSYRISERRACRGDTTASWDISLPQPQESVDGVADEDSRDRTGPSALWIPKDPSAAEPRGVGSGKDTGAVHVCTTKKD